MKDLLISKGFSLNSFPEGNFYELEMKGDKAKDLAKTLRIDDIDDMVDHIILQCTETFTFCVLYWNVGDSGGYTDDLSDEDFRTLVEQL